MRTSRRTLLRSLSATAAAVVFGPMGVDRAGEFTIRVPIKGRMTTLRAIGAGAGVLNAQWAYHPYQMQQYNMWAQWNMMQYQAYMQQMYLQHAWAQAYHAALAQQMQAYYSRGYTMSEPFAMDAVRSVYSYGNNRSGGDSLVGLNRYRSHVEAHGAPARLVSAIQDVGDDEGWDDEDIERRGLSLARALARKKSAVGPSAETDSEPERGNAFVSRRDFKDEDSGDEGRLIVFDSASGKERRLVPLYD